MTEAAILERDLRAAAPSGQLVVEYQPLFRTADAGTSDRFPVAVEALCRWHHPDLGVVMPDRFIPIAEQQRILPEIDAAVLAIAGATVREWQQAGHDIGLSVNATPTFFSPESVDDLVDRIEALGLRPGSITVEITEEPAPQLLPQVVAALPRLRAAGIATSIDDYGVGDTMLDQLGSLSIDEVKVDRSLSRRTDRAAEVQIAAVVALANDHGWRVVAEGIETPSDLERSLRRGFDRVQGFLLGRPMSAEGLERLLARFRRR